MICFHCQTKIQQEKRYFRMASIARNMKQHLSLIKYAKKYGATKAAIKYKANKRYISRLHFVETFEKHSSYSSMIFLKYLVKAFPYPIECIQTDNGQEFTKRFSSYGGSSKPIRSFPFWGIHVPESYLFPPLYILFIANILGIPLSIYNSNYSLHLYLTIHNGIMVNNHLTLIYF